MIQNRFSRSAEKVLKTIGVAVLFASSILHADTGALEIGWENPTQDARLRAYWWWLNGNVDAASITRDLEEMKAKGFGGALICTLVARARMETRRCPQDRSSCPRSGANFTAIRSERLRAWVWK